MLPIRKVAYKRVALFALLLLLAFSLYVSLYVGHLHITTADVLRLFQFPASVDAAQQTILRDVRLPRILMAAAAGAGLALAGALMQGLFRNPLADPSLVGVSSGAAVGAVVALVTGFMPIVPAAFIGGIVVTWLLFVGARMQGRSHLATMLLMGLAINALAGAVIGFILYLASESQTRSFFFWTLGSMARAEVNWPLTLTVSSVVTIGGVIVCRYSNALNALSLGEAEAGHLGFDVQRTQGWLVLLCALMVGGTVAACGIIGFVGLVVPHLSRMLFGPDHRHLLPASAIMGSLLLVFADMAVRSTSTGEELPLGIITALLGAPFFIGLILLARERVWQS